MKAHAGDMIEVRGRHIEDPPRRGEVLEVRGKDGGPVSDSVGRRPAPMHLLPRRRRHRASPRRGARGPAMSKIRDIVERPL